MSIFDQKSVLVPDDNEAATKGDLRELESNLRKDLASKKDLVKWKNEILQKRGFEFIETRLKNRGE